MSGAFLQKLIDQCEGSEQLCLLPVSRVLVENPAWISNRIAIFPPKTIAPQTLRVVEWPARRFAETMRRKGRDVITLSGDDLHWYKSAATNIDLDEFFGSALLACPVEIDWAAFLKPDSHEAHLEMLRAAMENCERTFDRVRFEQCNLWVPQMLPGRVGLLEDTPYCTGLFYSRVDHESYIIAGEIISHQLLLGVGTDMNGVFVAPIPPGELGALAKHALRLYSEALEAQSETSRFVQLMSIIEFLADPNKFTKTEDVKKAIGRQIARDRADYDEILRDFQYLATEKGPVTQHKPGLRHNIVHFGKRLEDLTMVLERRATFKRLTRYVCTPISQMIEHGDKNWDYISQLRENAKARLGLT